MILTFFNEYKNNNVLNKKYTDNIQREKEEEYFEVDRPSGSDYNQMVEETLENISKVKDKAIENILNEKVEVDPFFDEELLNHLDNLHSYISEYIPNYPKYYMKDGNKIRINPKAFLDSRDILKNELPLSVDEILNSSSSITGITNDTKMNFENGYQIDSDGNIYNPNREIVFNPKNPNEKVKFIDLLNRKVITTNGIRIPMPNNFVESFIKNNDKIDERFKNKLELLEEQINNSKDKASNTTIIDNIYATVNGTPITYEDRIFVEMELDDTFVGDIYGEEPNIDIIDVVSNYKKIQSSFGICNFKDIPYAELNSKLFWGGGQRGVKPLSSNNISDKDIAFAPNGTVYYSGSNSTISTRRAGCKSKTYKTGHVCMWSDSNKMGLKTSIIQYIYKFCNTFGLFNANIPMLIGFKKFKVFPGLCIGGLLEMALCGWQERISTRINEMFQCIPSSMPTDDSASLFENETFKHGCTVSTIKELDDINSCKFGDRYVVEVVESNITNLKQPACGVFVFDPNNKLSSGYKWKYKCWSGKPFNPRDNNVVIQEFNNMYDNPIIQDTLMNTNALGEDSITRKLMSLQYAFMKKQSLLAISDVDVSMDSIIESTAYEVLDKLTYKIANYIQLLDYKEQLQQDNSDENDIPKGGTPISFAEMFLNTYSSVVDKGILKSCPLDKCLRKYEKTVGGGSDEGGSSSTKTITYYDFSAYNPNEYLVPSYDNIEHADVVAFSALFTTNEELKEVYENNIKFLERLGQDTSSYKKSKTIRQYMNENGDKDGLDNNIEINLKYISHQLAYDGYDGRAFAQVKRRCDYAINTRVIF